ncbi:uncharacterized protein LOC125050168 isoform X4 [Pieris napi]|uniref:uncharacterized protein LOC125050168 isoform X4 n=1 Tax=Pieris napi TaxID=78633 RepID=UPI001FBBCDA8|nr:uncharacterized protein LOC125050168 isoform X4 [Pieris napi]
MVLENCQVVFNNYKGYFYSGDIVTGSVIFGLKHNSVVKGLVLNVKGTSKARWTRPMPTIPHIKVYSEKIEVLRIDISIDTKENTLLSKNLSIPFHFILPRNIPSSFQDSVAKTQYRVIIKTNKRLQKRVFPFVVVTHLNLNNFEFTSYNEKYLYELTKSFGKFKQYQFRIKTYKGIGSNQRNIPFVAYITNEKKIKVSKIVISLLQITVCFRFHFSMNMEIPVVIGSTPVIFTK